MTEARGIVKTEWGGEKEMERSKEEKRKGRTSARYVLSHKDFWTKNYTEEYAQLMFVQRGQLREITNKGKKGASSTGASEGFLD